MPNSSENDAMPHWVAGDLPRQSETDPPTPDRMHVAGVQEGDQSENEARLPLVPEAPSNAMDLLLAEAETANAAALALAHAQADEQLERLAEATPLLAGVLDALMAGFDEIGDEPGTVVAELATAGPIEGASASEPGADGHHSEDQPEDLPAGVMEPAAEPAAELERPVEGETGTNTPDKPRKRVKKAKDTRPAAAPTGAAEAVEAMSLAAGGPVVTMGSVSLNEQLELAALVESLLFVADGAVPVARLAEALEIHPREVEVALAELAESYQKRGLSLQRFRDKVQLTTSPAAAALVERFLGLAASTPLSRAALEALAIVTYQQPVTRPQIEAVRGVNSDSVIKNLLTKGLIEESGRAEGPGRPVLYSTTSEFMQHFGLATLSDLPPLTPPVANPEAEKTSAEHILKG